MNDKEKLKAIQHILNGVNASAVESIQSGLYDEHGISFETSKYGGVKLKAVEELKAEWINKGGQYETVARSMNEWFCFLRPDVKLPKDLFNQINANQDNLFSYMLTGYKVAVDDYYELLGNYQHRITKEYSFKLPDYHNPDYKNWITTNKTRVKRIANHYACAAGNDTNVRNPKFYDDFVKKIPDAILKIMNGKIEALNFPTNRMHP